ncbi:hypothetical protein LIER_16859 [Lithospermum erythrorhizon]|uniref:Uncharacterized protein n=1 Tax=Lithospermum erythrorhizon TaxID=34254 RepID=A0AAV3Q8Z9_LITER
MKLCCDGCDYLTNVDDMGCRIWVVWNPKVYKVVDSVISQQHRCCHVSKDGGLFWLSAIYGSNCSKERLDLWQSLKETRLKVGSAPWLLGGDFNILRFVEDDAKGVPAKTEYMDMFNKCIDEIEIDDFLARGCKYTWCVNWKEINQSSLRKLDRIMCNEACLYQFKTCEAFFETPGLSDHCSMLEVLNCPKPFRYQTFWEEHNTYKSIVEETSLQSSEGYGQIKDNNLK